MYKHIYIIRRICVIISNTMYYYNNNNYYFKPSLYDSYNIICTSSTRRSEVISIYHIEIIIRYLCKIVIFFSKEIIIL